MNIHYSRFVFRDPFTVCRTISCDWPTLSTAGRSLSARSNDVISPKVADQLVSASVCFCSPKAPIEAADPCVFFTLAGESAKCCSASKLLTATDRVGHADLPAVSVRPCRTICAGRYGLPCGPDPLKESAMLGFAIKGLVGLCLIVFGWLGGSIFPVPGQWLGGLSSRVNPILTELDLSSGGLARLRAALSTEDFTRLTRDAAMLAASTGDVILVERSDGPVLEEYAEAIALEQARATQMPPGRSVFEDTLQLCPGMTVSNAPPADDERRVEGYAKFVNVNGVTLAVNPTQGACLSSGVGARGGRRHKGLDFYARNGGPIFAAADGTVIEMLYRNDYGNMLLIDHGRGAYTRYAHLSSFAADVAVGSVITAGQQIGLMGNTASYQIPVHLHYEVLIGSYDNPQRSFGLTHASPFDFPAVSPTAPVAQGQALISADAVAPTLTPIVPLQLTRDEAGSGLCANGPLTEATVVRIRRGDTLIGIADACYGDPEAWRQIVDCNPFFAERNLGGVSPLNRGHLLYVGDRVVLPARGAQCPT